MQSYGTYSSPRRVRTIFFSDAHLGSRYARADELLSFLRGYQPESVYIVGDFIDGWSLRRSWHWQSACSQILKLLFHWARMGVTIRYTPGNHDEFFRGFLADFGLFQVADQFLYRRVDGRRYVITHGDQFETHASHSRWQSVVGGFGYDCLLWSNHIWNRGRAWVGRDAVQFSAKIKMGMRTVLRALDAFEQRISEYAQTLHCDGVVCGHVHVPRINFHDSINYCNTGDWVENCSALIEDLDGTFRIEHYNPETMAGETGQPVCVNATPPAPSYLRAMPVPFGRGFRTADQEPSPAGAEWRVAAGRDASDDREAGLVGSAARSRSSV